MNRSKFTSANGYQIDKFIEYYDIQTSEFPEIDELQELLRKQNKSEIEIDRQNTLRYKYANRIPSAEQFNYFCDCLVNMETFISTEVTDFVNNKQNEMKVFTSGKQTEIEHTQGEVINSVNVTKQDILTDIQKAKQDTIDYTNVKQDEMTGFINGKKLQIESIQGQVTANINTTKDSALTIIEKAKQDTINYSDNKQIEMTDFINDKKSQIETTQTQVADDINVVKDNALIIIDKKKENMVEYMDSTTAGAIRSDIGIKGELNTKSKDNLVDAINENVDRLDNLKSTKTVINDNKIDVIQGNYQINIKGNTQYLKGGMLVDEWQEGYTLNSLGSFSSNKIKISYDGKIDYIPTVLRKLDDRTVDEVKDNKIITRIGEIVLDGSEDFTVFNIKDVTICFKYTINHGASLSKSNNYMNIKNNEWLDTEGLSENASSMYFRILKSKLATPNVDGFKKWLSENPTTILYELETPVITEFNNNFVMENDGTIEVKDIMKPSEMTVIKGIIKCLQNQNKDNARLINELTLRVQELERKMLQFH